jgi:hypothetical protein
MNGNEAVKMRIPLAFLGASKWNLHSFADAPESAAKPELLVEKLGTADASESINLELAPAGGYAAILSKIK